MGKTWVLDTDTKGTGAEMVPLEKVLQRKGPAAPKDPPSSLRLRRRRRDRVVDEEQAPKPRQPRRFKIVDVMTREVVAEGVGARETLELLGRTRSTVDVRVYAWDPKATDWRPLTIGEQRLMRDRGVTDSE
jgi:hypothetical protein